MAVALSSDDAYHLIRAIDEWISAMARENGDHAHESWSVILAEIFDRDEYARILLKITEYSSTWISGERDTMLASIQRLAWTTRITAMVNDRTPHQPGFVEALSTTFNTRP